MEYATIKAQQDRYDYQLGVFLHNDDPKNIDEWHVDVLMPTRLLDPAVKQFLKIPDRSDDAYTFLRATQDTHRGPIYPGDRKLVMSIDYRVNTNVFGHSTVFDQIVKATAYIGGEISATKEERAGALVSFQRPAP
jgi:hypothetical protein